jgi:hypothetical protein
LDARFPGVTFQIAVFDLRALPEATGRQIATAEEKGCLIEPPQGSSDAVSRCA